MPMPSQAKLPCYRATVGAAGRGLRYFLAVPLDCLGMDMGSEEEFCIDGAPWAQLARTGLCMHGPLRLAEGAGGFARTRRGRLTGAATLLDATLLSALDVSPSRVGCGCGCGCLIYAQHHMHTQARAQRLWIGRDECRAVKTLGHTSTCTPTWLMTLPSPSYNAATKIWL
jgi:hypothetical protein